MNEYLEYLPDDITSYSTVGDRAFIGVKNHPLEIWLDLVKQEISTSNKVVDLTVQKSKAFDYLNDLFMENYNKTESHLKSLKESRIKLDEEYKVQYKVLCDEEEEVAREFEILEAKKDTIQKLLNNLF